MFKLAFPGSLFNSTSNPAVETSSCPAGGIESLQSVDRRGREPLDSSGGELLFEQRAARSQDSVDPGDARRLGPLLTKPGQQILSQPTVIELHRAQLTREPVDHPPLIVHVGLAEPAVRADLRAVILDRPPCEPVMGQLGRRTFTSPAT